MRFNEEPVVVFFPNKLNEGNSFSEWPLHLTIVPPALIDVEEVYNATRSSFDNTIDQREVGESDMFGEENNILVYHVHPEEKLREMHKKILARIGGAEVIRSGQTEWLDDNYSPHITAKPEQRSIATSDKYLFSNLTVVGKDQKSGLRIVRNVINIDKTLHEDR